MSLMYGHVLKPESVQEIEKMGLLAEQIADLWASGWPKRTKKLEASGRLIEALKTQVERELDVLARAREYTHLATFEINEMFGIDPAPPA